MDGCLHPFISFTYFSARPLNDTHSYTATPHCFDFLKLFLLPHTSTTYCTLFHFSSIWHQLPPPSCALSSQMLLFHSSPSLDFMQLASCCTQHSLFVFVANAVIPLVVFFFFNPGWLKETKYDRNDRGVIVSKGWVGLQCTRLLLEEAMWAFFCSLPGENLCVYVYVCVCVCWPPYNYVCVGRLFWYARCCSVCKC